MHHLVSLQNSDQLKIRAERWRGLCEDPFPAGIMQVLNAGLWICFRTIGRMNLILSALFAFRTAPCLKNQNPNLNVVAYCSRLSWDIVDAIKHSHTKIHKLGVGREKYFFPFRQ